MVRVSIAASMIVSLACGGKKEPPQPAPGSGLQSSGTGGSSAPPVVGAGSGSTTPGAGDPGVQGSGATTTPVDHPEDAELGVNIALAALGGRVVSPVDGKAHDWRASNLIDGFPVIRGAGLVKFSRGWRAEQRSLPQEVVLGFRADREATIATVVIDTVSDHNLQRPDSIPKDVEVLVSTTSPTAGFTRVAAAALPAVAAEAVLRFAPVKARYVKVVIASTHKGGEAQLGEIQVYEAGAATSIVEDVEKNLLLPALGGSIVQFTSQADRGLAVSLVDGVVNETDGWQTRAGSSGAANHLPQELTFAFRDHRQAFVDRVVIDPTSGIHGYSGKLPNTTTWAKTIEVMTSTASAWHGFASVAVVEMPPVGTPVVIPIKQSIRYVKVRVLESRGGDRVTLGEVQAFEGAAPGQRTVIAGRTIQAERAGSTAVGGTETATRREREPNNSMTEADPLDAPTPVGGALTPAGDLDVFRVPGGTGTQTITVSVEGQPAIRTEVAVLDGTGAALYRHDPAKVTGTTTRFSLQAGPGDVFVQVTQPPGAQVVIWDSSGSMKGRTDHLDAALRAYLGGVKPGDRVQLVRFDDEVEVVMDDFTDRSTDLVAALKNKVFYDGGTAIFDAIAKGVGLLQPVSGNRSIVMMTDGEDTTSRSDPSELYHALDRGRVRLYTIGVGDSLRNFVARAGTTGEHALANAALATGGRYFYVPDAANLGALYARIAEELRAPPTYAVAARSSAATGTLAVNAVGDRLALPPRVELILDASGSMKRKVAGVAMMDIARDVLTEVVARLPDDAQVALRLYGHRIADGKPRACEDSQLVIPFGTLDRARLTAKIKATKALGTTPIAYALTAAGKDLAAAKGPAMLILVTDGKEECGGDPAAAAAALRAQGLDVTLNIVGFGLTTADDKAAMTAVASAARGVFYPAADARALASAIDQALAVPFSVLDATGAVVARGSVGSAPATVPAGELTVRIDTADRPILIEHVVVLDGKASSIELTKDGDEVGVRIVAPPAGSTP
jgi:Mg-chelatase subunit ChlD